MKNDLDAMEDALAARVAPRGMGNPLRAGSGGTSATITAPTSTRVVEGKVKDEWLVGDPWDGDRYYFKEFDTK